jgi:glycine/D-amino acid oxidase-like deaminating enzyme
MQQKVILVGAGIAGLSIAFHLEKRKIPYVLIDSGVNHSSKIAAGIINPVVFRRMALSWRIHDFLPKAIGFYRELENKFQKKYLFHVPIRRAFAHQQEVDLWEKKLLDPAYSDFLKEINEDDLNHKIIRNSFGTGIVKESFWIDTKNLIDDWQQDLKNEEKIIFEKFDYGKINHIENKYKDISFSKIVFCEGYHGLKNPFFSYLPLQATKGELLTVKCEALPQNESLNYKCFILPIGNSNFKVGATYTWNTANVDLTNEAKIELEKHLKNLVSSEYTTENHEAGVRPTVLDRRPLLGEHPNFKNLFIYNGLGAKGYLISPKLSEEFLSHLLGESKLDNEVDIERYKNLNY